MPKESDVAFFSFTYSIFVKHIFPFGGILCILWFMCVFDKEVVLDFPMVVALARLPATPPIPTAFVSPPRVEDPPLVLCLFSVTMSLE